MVDQNHMLNTLNLVDLGERVYTTNTTIYDQHAYRVAGSSDKPNQRFTEVVAKSEYQYRFDQSSSENIFV
jgi:hypothetical protein